MTTYGDVRTKFISRMNRRDMDTTTADGFLQDTITRIQRIMRVPAMEKSIAVSIDSSYTTNGGIFIPSDYLQLRQITYNDQYELQKEDVSAVLPQAYASSGMPQIFGRRGGIWVLAPVPEGPATVTGVTNAVTAAGSTTLNFASTPAGLRAGGAIADLTASSVIPPGTTIVSVTPTTVVMSAAATGAGVGNGDLINFTVFNVVRIDYYAEFGPMAQVTDETALTDIASDLMVFGALSYGCDHFNDKRGPAFESRFTQILSDIEAMGDLDETSGSAAVQPAYFYSDDLEGTL